MSATDSFSCLWPRAIIELRSANAPGAPGAAAMLSPAIKPFLGQALFGNGGIRIDVTHMQQAMGSPVEIANRIWQLASDHGLPLPAIGVAGDPLIASYAAHYPLQERMRVIAPWEALARLGEERISRVGCSVPGLAQQMERAGIRTGGGLARLPEHVVQHHFGDTGLQLWRACKGIGGASAPEVVCRYNAVSCRVVLPPRTASTRSVNSHLRRVSGAFVHALQRIRRPAHQVRFVLRDEEFPDGVESGMMLTGANPPLPQLLQLLKRAMERVWSGAAVTHLELTAQNLPPPGGQLELFTAA